MKVYFTASLSGKAKFEKNYREIVKAIEKLGNKMVSNHVIETEFDKVKEANDKDLVKYYGKTLRNISSADLVVAEVSQPTIGVGHEVSLAIEKGKPVIVLIVEGSPMPQILKAVPMGNVTTLKYTFDNLERLISEALEGVKGVIPIRFNFFITPKINDFLDWISRAKRIPRAVFLRELLEKEMAKGKDYKKD